MEQKICCDSGEYMKGGQFFVRHWDLVCLKDYCIVVLKQ